MAVVAGAPEFTAEVTAVEMAVFTAVVTSVPVLTAVSTAVEIADWTALEVTC
jgi:hypothetical protein